MDEKIMHLLVFSNPVAGSEDEYNDWYDNQHLSDVVAVEGVRSAQRYESVGTPGGEPSPHGYLAIYECEGDITEILAEMGVRREDGRMPVTEGFDTSTAVSSIWAPRGPQVVDPS